MRLIILLCAYLSVGLGALSGQGHYIDSLNQMLLKAKTPMERIDVLLGLTRVHMLSNRYDQADTYCQKALSLARKHQLKDQEAIALTSLAGLDYNQGRDHYTRFNEAVTLAKRSRSKDAIAFATYMQVEFANYDPKEGQEILEGLLSETAGKISPKNEGNIWKSIAWQYEKAGDLTRAEEAYNRAIKVFRHLGDSIIIDKDLGRQSAQLIDRGRGNLIQCLLYSSQLYLRMNIPKKAIVLCDEALQLSDQTADIAYTQSYLGDAHYMAGNVEEAISAYQVAEEFYSSIKDRVNEASMHLRIGSVYELMKDFIHAESAFKKAHGLLRDVPQGAANSLMALGSLYIAIEKYDNALEVLLQADSLYQTIDDSISLINSQLRIADVQARNGLIELANGRILDLLPIIIEQKDLRLLYNAYHGLAQMHSDAQNKSQAIRYAKQALQTAEKRSFDKSILADAHSTLFRLSKEVGDFSTALAHHEQYHKYYDSIYTENAQSKLKEEQVKQNIAGYLEDKELALSNAALLAQRNKIYTIAALLLGLLLVLTVFFIFKLRQVSTRLKTQNLELINLNQTKDRFFSIIAHDIRSPIVALNSVEAQMKYYTKKNDTQKVLNIAGLVTKTAGQLNALLDNLLQWALTQTGRIAHKPSALNAHEIIGEILQLFEPNATSKGIKIKNEVRGELKVYADVNAFHTIFRNLISNAIKFTHQGGSVTVSSQKINERVMIKVSDSGKGISAARKVNLFVLEKNNEKGTAGEKGTGLGLVLCRDLIMQNKGNLTVESEAGKGSTFIVDLPGTDLDLQQQITT